MRVLSSFEVAQRTLRDLGLGPDPAGTLIRETLACSFRRVAGVHCPTSRSALLRAVIEPLRNLFDTPDSLEAIAAEVLEAVIAHGDLLELPEVSSLTNRPKTLIYSAPPMYLKRNSGATFLLGVSGEQSSLLPPEFERQIEHRGHVRVLPADASTEIAPRLEGLGFTELSERAWLQPPACMAPERFVERFDRALRQATHVTGPIADLRVIDPGSDTGYYLGRWTAEFTTVSAKVVGRRPQRFGSDIWCYVMLERGRPRRFVDLPVGKDPHRACDEAWRLQSALDSVNGKPQRLRIRPGPSGKQTFDAFSPLPMWLARRWSAIGQQSEHSPGALLSYNFDSQDVDEESEFACEMMWLAVDRST